VGCIHLEKFRTATIIFMAVNKRKVTSWNRQSNYRDGKALWSFPIPIERMKMNFRIEKVFSE
jgi:hypothetical protein